MEEIKSCPFCGSKPAINKDVTLWQDRSRLAMTPSHDIEVAWSIRCNQCGTSKTSPGRSYYTVGNDGQIKLVPQYIDTEKYKDVEHDMLKALINIWNTRN